MTTSRAAAQSTELSSQAGEAGFETRRLERLQEQVFVGVGFREDALRGDEDERSAARGRSEPAAAG